MYLIFDTETTGLIKQPGSFDNLNDFPYIVEIAWAVHDKNGLLKKNRSYIVRPDGWIVPENARNIHGISTEKAEKKGVPIRKVLKNFMWDVNKSDVIIGHNVSFDGRIVYAECIRNDMTCKVYDKDKTRVDTCRDEKYKEFVGKKFKNGTLMRPSLAALHEKLFNKPFKGAHSAAGDVAATAKCFFEFKKRYDKS